MRVLCVKSYRPYFSAGSVYQAEKVGQKIWNMYCVYRKADKSSGIRMHTLTYEGKFKELADET